MNKKIKGYRVRLTVEMNVFATNKADAIERAKDRMWQHRPNEDVLSAQYAGWVAHHNATGYAVLNGEDPSEYGIEFDTEEECLEAHQPTGGYRVA